jgi:predicted component of type VI protein secretion system
LRVAARRAQAAIVQGAPQWQGLRSRTMPKAARSQAVHMKEVIAGVSDTPQTCLTRTPHRHCNLAAQAAVRREFPVAFRLAPRRLAFRPAAIAAWTGRTT